MELGPLIEGAVKVGASDIHLMEDSPPYFRLDGDLIPVKHPPLAHGELMAIIKALTPDRLRSRLETRRGVDVSYQHLDLIRCRIIAFYERRRLRMVFRLIPLTIPSLDQLDLPPVLKTLADTFQGLVLVTGPTGSGKSTTLAAMIDCINSKEKISITTIEDPIEFVHQNKAGIVTQREVGDDVENFGQGVVQALRQDPDIILVGEMRDPETIRTAIEAAETGHFVLSTLHTSNAIQTVERVIAVFPQAEQELVRNQLSTNLRASITQTLVRRAEGRGRAAALEIMVVTGTVSKLIADDRLKDIYGVMQGGDEGMSTMDQALAVLVRAKKVAMDTAMQHAHDIHALTRYVRGAQASNDRGGIIAGFS